MMIYSIVPPEVIFAENTEFRHYEEIAYLGKKLLVQPKDERTYQIVQLISSEPNDFLATEFSPGTIITLH